MLFYGGTFLHYKKFVNKFLWLCAHVHKIFMLCAHAHIIGEHKKACTFILFLDKSGSISLKFSGENN